MSGSPSDHAQAICPWSGQEPAAIRLWKIESPEFQPMIKETLRKIFPGFRAFNNAMVVVLFLSAIWLYAFPAPTLTYAAMILLHAFGGLVALLCLIWFCLRRLRETSWIARLGWVALTAGGLIGGALVRMGTTRQNAKWLFLH